MRNLLKVLLLSAVAAICFNSCRNIDNVLPQLTFDEEDSIALVSKAKESINRLRQLNEFKEQYRQLDIQWGKSFIRKSKNGYVTIIVPCNYRNAPHDYRGSNFLYMFPHKNGNGFMPILYELVSEYRDAFALNPMGPLHRYSGVIVEHGLLEGPRFGTRYRNGVFIGKIKISSSENIPRCPRFDNEFYKQVVARSNSNLPPVTVSYTRSPNGYLTYHLSIEQSGFGMDFHYNSPGYNPCEYSSDCGNPNPNPDEIVPGELIGEWVRQLLLALWDRDHINDSTNNPCVGNVLNNLKALGNLLPGTLEKFFGEASDFNIKFTMYNNPHWVGTQAPAGANTDQNRFSFDYNIRINSYYENITDLGLAATILHEAMHAQFYAWFRETVVLHDTAAQRNLVETYGFSFMNNGDLAAQFPYIVSSQPLTHNAMATNERLITEMGTALFSYAQSQGINVSLDYCKDLAWTGTFDSPAWNKLSASDQERIGNVCNSEKDPFQSLEHNGIKVNESGVAKGVPCP